MYTKVNEKSNMLIIFMYVHDFIFTSDFGIKDFRTDVEREIEMAIWGL